MRWDDLFADLENTAAGLEQSARDWEIADRTRAELGRIGWSDRVRAAVGQPVQVRVLGLGVLHGTIARVTAPWLLLRPPEAVVEWLIAWGAVQGVQGLPSRTAPPGSLTVVESRWGWSATWRVLARDRTPVHVARRDGSAIGGVAERVGADFVELRAGSPDSYGHDRPTEQEVVPYTAITAVRYPRSPVESGLPGT